MKALLVSIIPILFFLASVITLKDYGINWDEPIHFNRGQGYLYYFLTGKTKQDQPITDRPSFFNGYDVDALYDWDGGHPVVSDIFAALSNFIFYQKLGITEDIHGYHLYNLLTSALTVFVVAIFAYKTYGFFVSLVSSLTLSLYPLFFSESHFNIKDPTQTAFFTLAIFALWKSLEKGSWKWLLLASVSAGFSFGTKFNIVFLPFIIIPYLFIRYFNVLKKGLRQITLEVKKIPNRYLFVGLISPVVVFLIFFASWPFLWKDPVEHILKVIFYYKNIATGFDYQPQQYTIGGFNLYAPFWILITTPPWTLFLLSIGIFYAVVKTDEAPTSLRSGHLLPQDKTHVNKLWLLWFTIPIIRVMMPGTTIYGGVRQIMEFLPAMALLSGLGSFALIKNFKLLNKNLLKVIILFAFLSQVMVLVKLHPNQNVYFNSFVGGVHGAKEKDIPSWGNSYGNAYWQAIKWINDNAEAGSNLALVQGTGQNIPLIQLREDINFSGNNWSGIARKGEYLLELTYEGSRRAYPYVWDYIEMFLDPVYEAKVDDVAIAKVWKNGIENTKPEMRKEETRYRYPKSILWKDNELNIDLGNVVKLTRIVIKDNVVAGCSKFGVVELSLDAVNWGIEAEKLNTEQVLRSLDIAGGVNFYFPGRSARFIRITFEENPCYLQGSGVIIYVLE